METGHTWQAEHYGVAEQWNGQVDTSKQGFYPGYGGDDGRNNVYQHHVTGNGVMNCDPGIYPSSHGHVVPMASSQLTCDAMVPQHLPGGSTAEIEHWHLQMMSQTDPFLVMPLRDGCGKRKRRRVISIDQRKAANVRERTRMYQLNHAFDGLRKRVPTFAYEKKLSRIETLKLAVTYIQFMSEMLENNGEKCKEMAEKCEKDEDLDNNNKPMDSDDVTNPASGTSSPIGQSGDTQTGDESSED